ncbi:MAG: protoglobin domain-containing protein [Candidatus Thiodiazotropha sp. 6PLUC2]
MADIDFEKLMHYSKQFSGLTAEMEVTLAELTDKVSPHLIEVTDSFYSVLLDIPKAEPFLSGRVESLKKTHIQWLETVFSGPFDVSYVEAMYHVGDVHVKVGLPVEFMAGAMSLVATRINQLLGNTFVDDPVYLVKAVTAVNAVLGFTLMIMQQSYESSRLAEELEKFLKITGMSRTLFDNLASAYTK